MIQLAIRLARCPTILPLGILSITFAIVYGGLLYYSGYIPYVLDGNESFSAFIHGRNLFEYGVGRSIGLTDESYGITAASHPYVYTHQGNFPRVYTFILYALGLRSIELQVVIVTFTIGPLAFLFAYLFFSKQVGRSFAVIVCLLFLTDYILVAEWVANSFRVWQIFFFFASLLLVERYDQLSRTLRRSLIGLLFACIFYNDLALAVFTLVTSILFGALRYWRFDRKVFFEFGLFCALGTALGSGVLVLQLIAYYGFENFLKDISLTFGARNFYGGGQSTIEQFFSDNNIVFWSSYSDSKKFLNITSFLTSFFEYGFSVSTPIIFLIVFSLLANLSGWIFFPKALQLLRQKCIENLVLFNILVAAAIVAAAAVYYAAKRADYYIEFNTNSEISTIGIVIVLVLIVIKATGKVSYVENVAYRKALALLGLMVVLGISLLAIPVRADSRSLLPWALGTAQSAVDKYLALLPILAAAISVILIPIARRFPTALDRILGPWVKIGILSANIIIVAAAVHLLGAAFAGPSFNTLQPIWHFMAAPPKLTGLALIVCVLTIFYPWFLAKDESQNSALQSIAAQMKPLWIYFAAVLIGYTTAYILIPGYVVVTNLQRYTPLMVFLTTPVIGVAMYFPFTTSVAFFRDYRGRLAPIPLPTLAAAFSSIPIVCFVSLYWIQVQAYWFRLLPPDGAAPYKHLADPKGPYLGHSFVSSTYAAPIAVFTGAPAFFDPQFILSGAYEVTNLRFKKHELEDYEWLSKFKRIGTNDYLWIADKRSGIYEFPDFALCYIGRSFLDAWERVALNNPNITIDSVRQYRRSCETLSPMFATHEAQSISSAHNHIKARRNLIERDPSALDSWAIVRLRTELPPIPPKIMEIRNTLNRNDEGWDIYYDIETASNPASPIRSNEVELLFSSRNTTCNWDLKAADTVRKITSRSSFRLPSNFTGALMTRARVRWDGGESDWKNGDIWIVSRTASNSSATSFRCAGIIFDGLFGEGGVRLQGNGWSAPEPWGTWTDGYKANLLPIPIGEEFKNEDLIVQADVMPFIGTPGQKQAVRVSANGKVVANWLFTDLNPQHIATALIPRQVFANEKTLSLSFDILNPTSPNSLGLSEDRRMLGIGLRQIRIKDIQLPPVDSRDSFISLRGAVSDSAIVMAGWSAPTENGITAIDQSAAIFVHGFKGHVTNASITVDALSLEEGKEIEVLINNIFVGKIEYGRSKYEFTLPEEAYISDQPLFVEFRKAIVADITSSVDNPLPLQLRGIHLVFLP